MRVAGAKLFCDGGEIEDVHQPCGHGDNDLCWARGHGVGLAGEGHDGGRGARRGEVVKVESAVPAGGDEDLVFSGVDNASYWLAMFAHDGLFAGLKVDSG